MDRRKQVTAAMVDRVATIGIVLEPCGFTFQHDCTQSSHTGPFASGYFVRGNTRIGLSCRDTIDNVIYEHSFVTQNASSREIEKFSTSHSGLMQFLGHHDDAQLISGDSIPDAAVARDGGDRVGALIHDLTEFVIPLFTNDMVTFLTAIRRGFRSYSIE